MPETMASEKLPVKETGNDNELSSSLTTDVSPSIAETSTHPGSGLLVADDKSVPETLTTSEKSMVEEDKASEELPVKETGNEEVPAKKTDNEELPAKETDNEPSSSITTNVSPSATNFSPHAASGQLMSDHSPVPETPITAKKSVVDEANVSNSLATNVSALIKSNSSHAESSHLVTDNSSFPETLITANKSVADEGKVSEELPVKQAGNELSSSSTTDASPSIPNTSTQVDSSLLMTDEGSLPETPTTANTSVFDGKASEERRDSIDAEHDLFADINDNGEDDGKSSQLFLVVRKLFIFYICVDVVRRR